MNTKKVKKTKYSARFEHIAFKISEDIPEALKLMSKGGWELVAVTREMNSQPYVLWWKRPVVAIVAKRGSKKKP